MKRIKLLITHPIVLVLTCSPLSLCPVLEIIHKVVVQDTVSHVNIIMRLIVGVISFLIVTFSTQNDQPITTFTGWLIYKVILFYLGIVPRFVRIKSILYGQTFSLFSITSTLYVANGEFSSQQHIGALSAGNCSIALKMLEYGMRRVYS